MYSWTAARITVGLNFVSTRFNGRAEEGRKEDIVWVSREGSRGEALPPAWTISALSFVLIARFWKMCHTRDGGRKYGH